VILGKFENEAKPRFLIFPEITLEVFRERDLAAGKDAEVGKVETVLSRPGRGGRDKTVETAAKTEALFPGESPL
jgi:hypothetical protein